MDSGVCLTVSVVQDTLDILKGAVMICYPMGLPSYEIIHLELEGKEDLTGTQVCYFQNHTFYKFIYMFRKS